MLKSKISIEANYSDGRTYLGESFHNAPYKVVHYGSKNLHKHLEMIIMSASPGMMEGDALNIDIQVKERAQLRLYTQSFNKLHPMKEKGAEQHTSVQLGEESIFHYIPHPVTPFEHSIFKTINEINMPQNSTLIWGDIIASGRVARGESFLFDRLHSITKVKVDKKLLIYDNQLLEPKEQPISSLLFYEDYTHQATLLYVSPYGTLLKEELDEIFIGQYNEFTFGFSSCGKNAVMIRAMGNDGEQLYEWITGMGRLCWEFTQHKIKERMGEESGIEGNENTSPKEQPIPQSVS